MRKNLSMKRLHRLAILWSQESPKESAKRQQLTLAFLDFVDKKKNEELLTFKN